MCLNAWISHPNLQSAVNSLCGRFLDFSTIPLGLAAVAAVPQSQPVSSREGYEQEEESWARIETEEGADTHSLSAEIEALSALLSPSLELGAGEVGVELTTELLRHCVTGSTEEPFLFSKLAVDPARTYSVHTLLEVLDFLHSKGLVSVLLCASNVFTLPVALQVQQWATRKVGVSFLASEVLRAHPRSPGLLVSPSAANAGE